MDESELPDLTCTDIEQQWGALKKTSLKEFEAKRLKDFCHVKDQKNVYVFTLPEVTPQMEKKWIDRLLRCKLN